MTVKERIEELKVKGKDSIKKGVQFIDKHQGEIIAVSTIVGIPAFGTIRSGLKKAKKDRTYWDASTNHHWEAKHKLTNRERLLVERYRKEHNCNLGEALLALGLLHR